MHPLTRCHKPKKQTVLLRRFKNSNKQQQLQVFPVFVTDILLFFYSQMYSVVEVFHAK